MSPDPLDAARVTVAAVQAAPVFLDREATVDKAAGLIKQAAADGAQLVAFPETFVPTYPDWIWRTTPWTDGAAGWYERLVSAAVTIPSPTTEALGKAHGRPGPTSASASTSSPVAPCTTPSSGFHPTGRSPPRTAS